MVRYFLFQIISLSWFEALYFLEACVCVDRQCILQEQLKNAGLQSGTLIRKQQAKIAETNLIQLPSPYTGLLTTLLYFPLPFWFQFSASYSAWEIIADWYTVITHLIYLFFFIIVQPSALPAVCHPNSSWMLKCFNLWICRNYLKIHICTL